MGPFQLLILIILLVPVICVLFADRDNHSDFQSEEDLHYPQNKVINVTLTGGIIGALVSSPKNRLNTKIGAVNEEGWKVIQIIPANSGNIFLTIGRIILLIITLFLYTKENGYYVVLEKK